VSAAGCRAEHLHQRHGGREPDLAESDAWVHAAPSALTVLNHPLWNAHIDVAQAATTLSEFVRLHRPFLHATEINGYRRHAENKAVVRLAREWNLPVLAGGDRHGRAPNAMVNLTSARTFAGFVDEVRRGGVAHTVVLPDYREHTATRVLAVVADVLCENSVGDPLQRHWTQAVSAVPRYLVQDGVNGFLRPEVAGQADAVCDLMRNQGRAAAMGLAARESARAASWPRIVSAGLARRRRQPATARA
jgi:glycosyltransferase involved in cell wall biosynthesis